MNSPISDEPAQMQPRSKTPAEKTESSGWTWPLNPAGLSLPVYSQPATSLLVKAADPQTETEGLRPGFSEISFESQVLRVLSAREYGSLARRTIGLATLSERSVR